jgi:HEAT repeat protein
MPFTKEEIIKMINLDEPEYEAIVRKFTEDDIPTLIELANHENPAIATKAISCLGLLKNEKALKGLSVAVNHPDPVHRIAAAHSLRNMASIPGSVQLLEKLLEDKDIGVRKFALKTVEAGNIKSLKEKVRVLNQREINPALKTLGENIIEKLKCNFF